MYGSRARVCSGGAALVSSGVSCDVDCSRLCDVLHVRDTSHYVTDARIPLPSDRTVRSRLRLLEIGCKHLFHLASSSNEQCYTFSPIRPAYRLPRRRRPGTAYLHASVPFTTVTSTHERHSEYSLIDTVDKSTCLHTLAIESFTYIVSRSLPGSHGAWSLPIKLTHARRL